MLLVPEIPLTAGRWAIDEEEPFLRCPFCFLPKWEVKQDTKKGKVGGGYTANCRGCQSRLFAKSPKKFYVAIGAMLEVGANGFDLASSMRAHLRHLAVESLRPEKWVRSASRGRTRLELVDAHGCLFCSEQMVALVETQDGAWYARCLHCRVNGFVRQESSLCSLIGWSVWLAKTPATEERRDAWKTTGGRHWRSLRKEPATIGAAQSAPGKPLERTAAR